MEVEDPDHYLHVFTDEELTDILKNPDDWRPRDVDAAKKILIQRGIAVDQINPNKGNHPDFTNGPQPASPVLIIAGYISAIFAGVTAVIIGLYISYRKKTLPSGERIFAYIKSDRQQGMYIFLLGIAAIVVTICLRMFMLKFFGFRLFRWMSL